MPTLRLVHRWTGGIIGIMLALIGLSGALLAWKESWIALPGVEAPPPPTFDETVRLVEAVMGDADNRPQSILFASDSFGLNQLNYSRQSGAYVDGTGSVVAQWDSTWDRPELWLFDFHHHLFAGEAGETVTGFLGLVGIGFIITGVILWWPTRRTFAFRLWPARMTSAAIVRQHRDLGIVIAPLLMISCLTGVMMTLRPVAELVLTPLGAKQGEIERALAPPNVEGNPLAANPDWRAILATAKARFPDAELRVLSLPRKPGGLISVRMKQPDEWSPKGRTTLWFAPDTGRLVEARDALELPPAVRIFNLALPLHTANVGGIAWRLAITAGGLGLALLGGLATWGFWRQRTAGTASRLRTASG